MASKGNGVAKTNELLVQILGELGAMRKEQVELRKVVEGQGETLREHGQMLREQGQILREQGQILREHGQILREQGQILREHGQILGDVKSDIHQLNRNIAQIAQYVGEHRARQEQEIQDIRVRVEALERRAA